MPMLDQPTRLSRRQRARQRDSEAKESLTMKVRWAEYQLANVPVAAQLPAAFRAEAASAAQALATWVAEHPNCPSGEYEKRRDDFVAKYVVPIDQATDAYVEERDLEATAALVAYVTKARREMGSGTAFADALAAEEAYIAENPYMSEEDAVPRLRALRRLA
ncbi:hypothetical protein HDU87_003841 [Geranomyces variabilis]|uniref:Uncharacterized protein n=1 Tax=Geranomyces variabilis TaxID=109894 RepID=A0AAD5TJQ2_9FUNG|nr:hypothetical protein HDU87_003841 [Geranomyces variabilis]